MQPFKSSPTPENTRAIPGAVFHFLVRGQQTGDSFSLIQIQVQRGAEPPAHVHQREDESYYVLAGSVHYYIGQQEFVANAGDYVYLPKGVTHQFQVLSESARLLMWISPAGLDEWFWENSAPAPEGKPLPVPAGPPPQEAVEHFVGTLAEYGVIMQPALAFLH
jgi:quercetin dioxygenase-like cupin family protein